MSDQATVPLRTGGANPAVAECPKDMVFGPCGGVTPDNGCEVDGRPCPFVDNVVTTPPAGTEHRPRAIDLGRAVVDLRLPTDDATLAEVVQIYRAIGATVLVGEHVDDPGDHTPHDHARRLRDHELPAVVTVTGRRRSLEAHEDEIRQLVAEDVVAIHCVTGDHPAARFGPDADATFTLDGTRLASLARRAGAKVSVAESPASPPADARAERLVTKQSAGADVAILNHAGSAADLVDFAERTTTAGAELALVAPVPVITDAESARALVQFPGLVLPDGFTDSVLTSADPGRTGIELAIELGRELLASGHFAAVNLSGAATADGPVERARIMAEVVEALDA